MTKTAALLALLLLVGPAGAVQVQAHAPALLRQADGDASPELVACALVTLAALVLAWIGLRRSAAVGERAHALQLQLSCEREARIQADQALADSHDLMCRLVCQDPGPGERSRACTRHARDLQAELGWRISVLRGELACLHDGVGSAPGLARRLDRALANIDGALDRLQALDGVLRRPDSGAGEHGGRRLRCGPIRESVEMA